MVIIRSFNFVAIEESQNNLGVNARNQLTFNELIKTLMEGMEKVGNNLTKIENIKE